MFFKPYFSLAQIFICFTQAGALEKIVKASQLEIIELQHSVGELRYLLAFSILYSCT